MSDDYQLLHRAQSLMDIQRYDQALEVLQAALATNPENERAHLLLLFCLTHLGKTHRAIEQGRELLGRFPNAPVLYQLLAANLADAQQLDEAQSMAEQGLEVAPGDVELLAVLGRIALSQKDWGKALYHSQDILEQVPDHLQGLNIRLTALNKLGHKDELRASLKDTLAADPNNPYTHNNIGWTELEAGHPHQAKAHFAEALRLQPNLEGARVGLLESLKAKNIFYRALLGWMFFMAKQKEQAQWFIIIGAYLLYRFLISQATQYPILIPVVYLIAFFFYLSWIIHPLSNLLIKLDPVARHALTEEESKAANAVGIGLTVGGSLILTHLFVGHTLVLLSGLFALSILIPTSMYFEFINTNREGQARWAMLGLWALGLTSLLLIGVGEWRGNLLWTGYFLSFLAYSFVANYWAMRSYRVD